MNKQILNKVLTALQGYNTKTVKLNFYMEYHVGLFYDCDAYDEYGRMVDPEFSIELTYIDIGEFATYNRKQLYDALLTSLENAGLGDSVDIYPLNSGDFNTIEID